MSRETDMEAVMAAREMAAWASLAITLFVWGPYVAFLTRELGGGTPDGAAILAAIIEAVILSVILSIIVAIVLALVTRGAADAPEDERERLISLRATDAAYTILTVGVVSVAVWTAVAATGRLDLFPIFPAADASLVAANGVLFAVIVAEVVRSGLQIARYRLGA